MANDLPDHVAIDTIWVIEATYGPRARELRPAFRGEHLERIMRLRDEGVVIEAGGYLDWSTALVLVHAPDEASALALAEADVYTRNGVWTEVRARQLGRVVRPEELPGSE